MLHGIVFNVQIQLPESLDPVNILNVEDWKKSSYITDSVVQLSILNLFISTLERV